MWRLGIDLGGTKTLLAVGDRAGRLRARRRLPTEPSGDAARDVARLLERAREVIDAAGLAPGELEAVGVAVPGPIDFTDGCVVAPPNLPGWERVALRSAFVEALGVPVHLDNDANAAALAEWRFGDARGAQHAVYLTMSTGVGAGLILDGRLYRGAGGNAGEVGHVAIERGGALCACGQRGCFEAYVGGAAWTRRLRAEAPDASACLALAGARDALGPEHVLTAARAGDAFAREEVARYTAHLVEGLSQVVYAFAPEVIVLGTIVGAGADLMLEPLRRGLRARVWPLLESRVRLAPAALGERLPELAALCVAFQRGESES